jgi:hypothetical protein
MELQIYKNAEFGSLKEIEKSRMSEYIGFFYILEWGGAVKIGSTKNPYQRVMSLKRQAERYGNTVIGDLLLSQGHTNYWGNELILHRHFSDYQKGNTELYEVSFQQVLSDMPDDICFLDETKRMEKDSEIACSFMRQVLAGGAK